MCLPTRFVFGPCSMPKKEILMGDNRPLPVAAMGTVRLRVRHGGTVHVLDITRVLFVPELRSNLLSVSQLGEKGVKVVFENTGCSLKLHKEVLARATLEDKLYVLTPLLPANLCPNYRPPSQ